MQTLVEKVKNDVIAFLDKNQKLMFNERDFQMNLVVSLSNSVNKYDKVELEYYVPREELKDYIWNNELRLDIVVMKDGEFVPVELKYKTKAVDESRLKSNSISRFGETLKRYGIIKNQAAQNLAMYGFWKDVRRLELIRQRFQKVSGGLAIFLTNDPLYKNDPGVTSANRRKTPVYQKFNMSDGWHDTDKSWIAPNPTRENSYPSFKLDKKYQIHWEAKNYEGVNFFYCIAEV